MSSRFIERLDLEFKAFENSLNGDKNSYLNNIRRKAFDKFKRLGLPTAKHEEWRFTNIGFVNKFDFEQNLKPDDSGIVHSDIEKFLFDRIRENVIVFVNGFFSKSLSRIVSNGNKIKIGSLYDVLKEGNDSFVQQFKTYLTNPDDPFTLLNCSFASDGAYIKIEDGVELDEPIHLLYVQDTKAKTVLSNPRNIIIAGKNSKVRMIQTVQTVGKNPGFTNLVTLIHAGEGSNVEFSKLQHDFGKKYYIGTTQVNMEKDSTFHNATFSLKGSFIRNNLNIVMNGQGCDTKLYGFYYLDEKDFVDNHTFVDHAMPNCTSDELYKGIMDDESKAVFSGKVMVRPDAQKTNAFQTNKNILLTDEAKVNTKPQLEIYADDVKCSHGATSGYLNEEAMFYMKQRGIEEETARALLLNAFAIDVVEKINIHRMRDDVKEKIAHRLKVDEIYFCDFIDG